MSVNQNEQQKLAQIIELKKSALDKIDNSKLGWQYVKNCLVGGIGMYNNGYDLFVIANVTQLLGYVYYSGSKNQVPKDISVMLKLSGLIGTFFGETIIGYLCDLYGRKTMFIVNSFFMVIFTIISCFSADTPCGMSVFGMIMFWRFLLGIGLGGDYPVMSSNTSENSTQKNRGQLLASIKVMQGLGILSGSLIPLILILILKTGIEGASPATYLDLLWRLVFLYGAIPAIIAFYYRVKSLESVRYTIEVKGDLAQGLKDANVFVQGQQQTQVQTNESQNMSIAPMVPVLKVSQDQFFQHFSKPKPKIILISTCIIYFCQAFVYYGTNLNNPTILSGLNLPNKTIYETILYVTLGNFVISLLGQVPGYFLTFFLIDRIGRKTIQLLGFGMVSTLFIILAASYTTLVTHSTVMFFVLYTLSQLFQTFGANSTAYIIPGELFPTRFRARCNGLTTGAGKLGAIASTALFGYIKDYGGAKDSNAFLPYIFILFAASSIIGFLAAVTLPETMNKSLEELNGEDLDVQIQPQEIEMPNQRVESQYQVVPAVQE